VLSEREREREREREEKWNRGWFVGEKNESFERHDVTTSKTLLKISHSLAVEPIHSPYASFVGELLHHTSVHVHRDRRAS